MSIEGKKILLGVTGSIAAYKSASLIRLLVKAGADVQVIMTSSATDFISPLTLATLSKRPVLQAYFDKQSGQWHSHVELGLWADIMLVAPLSAQTLSAFAQGRCENLLQATYLSARCPVWVAPAMDLDMYVHPSTQRNLDLISADRVHIIPAETGELASGLYGQGRMAEPEQIFDLLENHFKSGMALRNTKVLLTSGPTREAIDPVRFISNHSTGKMGAAIAEALLNLGAEVHMVAGPSQVYPKPNPRLKIYHVQSAEEMSVQAEQLFGQCRLAVLTAAVADYQAAQPSEQKIKKSSDELSISLRKTKDIAAGLGKIKKADQFIIGFALETQDERVNAKEKLNRKNMDMIVLNSLSDAGAGFGHDTNKVTFLFQSGEEKSLPLLSKAEVAIAISEVAVNWLASDLGNR